MSGHPKFQYHIDHVELANGGKPWYVIITSTGRHFYFNADTKQSYWQLADLFRVGVERQIVEKIDFDAIAVLVAKANGIRSKEDGKREQKGNDTVHVKGTEVVKVDEVEEDEEVEEEEEEEVEEEVDEVEENKEYEAERDEFIAQLLKEEGWEKKAEREAASEEIGEDSPEVKTVAVSGGLDLGYSSLEEEDGDEDEKEGAEGEHIETIQQKTLGEDAEDAETIQHENPGKDADDAEHKTELNGSSEEVPDVGSEEDVSALDSDVENTGLDLELTDDDEHEEFKETSLNAFVSLLDDFSSQISIYDPWFMVEEELLSEWIKDPRYYSVESATREEAFNSWVTTKAKTETETGGHLQTESFAKLPQIFPTPIQHYFNFLQEKKEMSKMYYVDFKRETRSELQDHIHALGDNKCETLFRQYALMLKSFRTFEKSEKKKNPSLGVNLKKRHLDQFLEAHISKAVSTVGGGAYDKEYVVEEIGRRLQEAEATNSDYLALWYIVCNVLGTSKTVAEDVANYIVGPQKRLDSYVELLHKSN